MLGWSVILFFFWLYRCVYSVVGQLIVVQLTTLGDSPRYQGAYKKFSGIDAAFFTDSTHMTEGIGLALATVLGERPVLINIAYQSIAFYGIARLLMAVEPKLRKAFLLLLLLPTFNLWTSVAGKEAVIVFALGVLCSLLVESYYNRARVGAIHALAAALLALFKPHYFLALAFIFGLTWAGRRVRQKEALVLLAGLTTLMALAAVAPKVNELSFEIIGHFSVEGARSTREAFWVEPYDVFWKAPLGMYLGFVGPTFEEAFRMPLHMASFVESMAVLAALLVLLLWRLPRMPVYNFLLGLFTLFWLLFVNYPFGVMNPGSAIRYRAGYYLLVVTVFAFILSRQIFVDWRAGAVTGKPRRPRIRFVWGAPRGRPP